MPGRTLQAGDDLAHHAPARFRARREARRSGMDYRHPVPDRHRQDLHGKAAGVHPAVGHARGFDPGDHDQPPGIGPRRRFPPVLGPYYWEGAPEAAAAGANLAVGVKGEPTYYSGRVLSSDGKPIAGAILDIWSGDGEGTYDMQMEGDVGMKARGRIRTDAQGRYSFRSIKPEYYRCPPTGLWGAS